MTFKKVCIKCGISKPIENFCRASQNKDGRKNTCRECCRLYRGGHPTSKEKQKEYRRGNRLRHKEKAAKQRREWRRENLLAYKAHNKVQNAIRHGKLTKPEKCEWCGQRDNLQATHDDYSKPFDVEWLCPKCHSIKDGNIIGATA